MKTFDNNNWYIEEKELTGDQYREVCKYLLSNYPNMDKDYEHVELVAKGMIRGNDLFDVTGVIDGEYFVDNLPSDDFEKCAKITYEEFEKYLLNDWYGVDCHVDEDIRDNVKLRQEISLQCISRNVIIENSVMIDKNIRNKTVSMLERAYEMFPNKHEPSKYLSESETPFPICSFERAATIFWSSLIENMYKRGMTDSEVEWLLRSKNMRWMLDELSDSPDLNLFTDSLLTDSMIEYVKREAGDITMNNKQPKRTPQYIIDAVNTCIGIGSEDNSKSLANTCKTKTYKYMCGVYYKLGNEEIVSTGYWSECEDALQDKANKSG